MLTRNNKEYRNLQEQVEWNKNKILEMEEGQTVLNQFGIKVVEQVETVEDIPTVEEYKAAHEDWEFGDAYAVGVTTPYELYILTRANESHEDDYWFDIGEFPLAGPQGLQGLQGIQGLPGTNGVSAGIATPVVDNSEANKVGTARVSITATGPDTAKEFTFKFFNLKGAKGDEGDVGPRGNDGQSMHIVGQVDTATQLPVDAELGDAYFVGTTAPRNVYAYIYYADTIQWVNQGELGGIPGPEGPAGDSGVEDMESMDATYDDVSVAYDAQDGMFIYSTAHITQRNENTNDIDFSMGIPIVPREGEILIDATPEDKIVIGLDEDLSDKMSKVLVLPDTTPTVTKVPIITTSNAQVNADVGGFLEYAAGALNLKCTVVNGVVLEFDGEETAEYNNAAITSSNLVLVSFAEGMTKAELDEAAKCMIRATSQSTGKITFTALSGIAPAEDITVNLIILG